MTTKNQVVPKFEYTLGEHDIVIPAVLFHFASPEQIYPLLREAAKTYDGNSSAGVCWMLESALSSRSIDAIVPTIARAICFYNHTTKEICDRIYLENYVKYRFGLTSVHYTLKEMEELRQEWFMHITRSFARYANK